MSDYITTYSDAIRSGDIVTSAKVAAIYGRLADEIAADSGRWAFDQAKAEKAVTFCERYCRQSKSPWAGRPLELLLWQKALVSAIFGFVDRETGLRRFHEVFLCVSRKCGKSSLAAAISLYLLYSEQGGECYIVATKLDQAYHLYDECDAMISQSPQLRARARRRRSDIYLPKSRSILKPLGSKSSSLDGLNSTMCVADEIHAWKGESGRRLYNVLRESMSTREEPLFLVTTTAGFEREGIFDDLYALSQGVIDGTISQDRFLPIVYELDDVAEWRPEGDEIPSAWYKANPSLGAFKRIDDLKEKVSRAIQTGEYRNLLVKDFDCRMSASNAWLTFEEIVNHATFDLSDLRGRWAIAGVDLSSSGDLTSAGILMPDDGDGWLWYCMSWLPEDLLEDHERLDDVPYGQWRRQGYLRTCEGNKIKFSDVTAWLMECVNELGVSIRWCGYDRWSSQYWVDDAARTGMQLEEVIQGAQTLSNPMKDLAQELRAHNVNYGDNPLVAWALSNTNELTDRNENIRPVKERASMRIDPTMALLDAWTVLLRHHNEFMSLNGRDDRRIEGMS